MKVAIVGSRNFKDLHKVVDFVRSLSKGIVVISGGAQGVDLIAEHEAVLNGLETEIYKPDWLKYGKAAGPIRNELIIANADEVVAFWDGTSRGTLSSINIAKRLNKPLTIIK